MAASHVQSFAQAYASSLLDDTDFMGVAEFASIHNIDLTDNELEEAYHLVITADVNVGG